MRFTKYQKIINDSENVLSKYATLAIDSAQSNLPNLHPAEDKESSSSDNGPERIQKMVQKN